MTDTTRITAQEAFSISKVEFEKCNNMENKIDEFMREVYIRIREATTKGKFSTSVKIGMSWYDKIIKILEEDGYNVHYDQYMTLDGSKIYEYLVICWGDAK